MHSSRCERTLSAMFSLSVRISERLLVPSTFLRVVQARRLVEVLASFTLVTDRMGSLEQQKYDILFAFRIINEFTHVDAVVNDGVNLDGD